jgi:hypothetical protein
MVIRNSRARRKSVTPLMHSHIVVVRLIERQHHRHLLTIAELLTREETTSIRTRASST